MSQQPPASNASQHQHQHQGSTTTTETAEAVPQRHHFSGTLRLRGHGTQNGSTETRHIRWAEDVVDNEGQGKKSSKVCCIYHKPRAVGESSSESDSDSDSSSSSDTDSDMDNGEARMSNGGRGQRRGHDHGHGDHDNNCDGEDHGPASSKPMKGKKPARRKPNAYERMPRTSKASQDKAGK